MQSKYIPAFEFFLNFSISNARLNSTVHKYIIDEKDNTIRNSSCGLCDTERTACRTGKTAMPDGGADIPAVCEGC